MEDPRALGKAAEVRFAADRKFPTLSFTFRFSVFQSRKVKVLVSISGSALYLKSSKVASKFAQLPKLNCTVKSFL